VFHIIPHRALIEPKVSVLDVREAGGVATATLQVDGLLCSACAANVRCRLEKTRGVHSATVDLETALATVAYDPAQASPGDLIAAVDSTVILRPLRRLLERFAGRRPAAREESA
jgi:copper chaperone CopZ